MLFRSGRSVRCVVCNYDAAPLVPVLMCVYVCAHDTIRSNSRLWTKKRANEKVNALKEGVRHPTDILVFNVKSNSNSIANHHHWRRSCDLLQSDNRINHKKNPHNKSDWHLQWNRIVQYRLLLCQLCKIMICVIFSSCIQTYLCH